MKLQLLKINEIVIDEKLYPRMNYLWQVAYDYSQSIKAGATFPPITVAKIDGTYLLVDGKHRIEASKLCKYTHIQAEILKGLTEKQIFVEAIKRNISHGKGLSIQDRTMIITKLKDMNYSFKDISKLVKIPIDKLQKFQAERMTYTITNKPIFLKPSTKHFAGKPVKEDFDMIQKQYANNSQISLMDEFISLLENKLIDFSNPKIIIKLNKIYDLLRELRKKKTQYKR